MSNKPYTTMVSFACTWFGGNTFEGTSKTFKARDHKVDPGLKVNHKTISVKSGFTSTVPLSHYPLSFVHLDGFTSETGGFRTCFARFRGSFGSEKAWDRCPKTEVKGWTPKTPTKGLFKDSSSDSFLFLRCLCSSIIYCFFVLVPESSSVSFFSLLQFSGWHENVRTVLSLQQRIVWGPNQPDDQKASGRIDVCR